MSGATRSSGAAAAAQVNKWQLKRRRQIATSERLGGGTEDEPRAQARPGSRLLFASRRHHLSGHPGAEWEERPARLEECVQFNVRAPQPMQSALKAPLLESRHGDLLNSTEAIMMSQHSNSFVVDECQPSAGIHRLPQNHFNESRELPTAGGCSNRTLTANDNSSAQMTMLDLINHQEINFAEIETVWLVKSWQEILLRVLFVAPIVLFGIIGNLKIIYSMYKFKRFRSKPTNVFILNMALADLLTTIVCPNAALFTDIYQFYVLGAFLCRFEGFIKITCLLVSAYSLIVLSFDWLLCVVKPCRTRISIRQSWLSLASIWIVSVLMASPLFVWRRLRERQWKDLLEVWCCEQIQYSKYYWIGITFFLIYLPTFIMTIVLVVILLQMDRFEAKLRRSRQEGGCRGSRALAPTTPSASLTPELYSGGSSRAHTGASLAAGHSLESGHSQTESSGSLTISMKYKRRIMKFMFVYLLTSIICWTPLQLCIIYRHFRSEAVPAWWFFELVFYSQICASLSGVMNPIIFGFLSEPFRRFVAKFWMFRLVGKFFAPSEKHAKLRPRTVAGREQIQQQQFALSQRVGVVAKVQQQQQRGSKLLGRNRQVAGDNLFSGLQLRSSGTREYDTAPRLTLDYIEHNNSNNLSRTQSISEKATLDARRRMGRESGSQRAVFTISQRAENVTEGGNSLAINNDRLLMGNFQELRAQPPQMDATREMAHHRAHRSNGSSQTIGMRDRPAQPGDREGQIADKNVNHNNKRVSFNTSTESLRVIQSHGVRGGEDNQAYQHDNG